MPKDKKDAGTRITVTIDDERLPFIREQQNDQGRSIRWVVNEGLKALEDKLKGGKR